MYGGHTTIAMTAAKAQPKGEQQQQQWHPSPMRGHD